MNNGQIILSYHKFVDEESDYRFSRTYDQFYHDIRKKVYDLITIDDGMKCLLKACEILQAYNVKAKLFICTSLIGTEGYCTWKQLQALSIFHDIENHSHIHKDHSKLSYDAQFESMNKAQWLIGKNIGRKPRLFVAPFNQYNENTNRIAKELKLVCVKSRETVLNDSK